MKRVWLAVLLTTATASAQQAPPQQPPMAGRQERQELQRMIVQGFMDQVSNQLRLDQGQRQKLMVQLRQSGERRRQLAKSTNDLRQRIMVASRDSTATDADFKKMLNDLTALRQREDDLWKQDQDELAKILTPRQQARFVFMWLRFNEQVREAAMMRPQPRGF